MVPQPATIAARRAADNPNENFEVRRQAREYLKNCNDGMISRTDNRNIFFQYNTQYRKGDAGSFAIDRINKNTQSLALTQASREAKEYEDRHRSACCSVM